MNYSPGHCWFYYSRGDAQKPLPVEQIPASDWVAMHNGNPDKPPKDLPSAIEKCRRSLDQDIARYQDLVNRGVEAVSEFDVKICCGGDGDLALSCALSLKYNHICYNSGYLRWLESFLPKPAFVACRVLPDFTNRPY